jgi:4-hydroxybenzoate polyprenyltransferase
MLRTIRHLLELIRFSHTLFALPFALLSAAMAWTLGARSQPPHPWRWQELAGILLCMVAARSAAMAFNRLAVEKLDAVNPRTGRRHLPGGLLSRQAVWGFAAVAALLFIGGTLLFLPNRLPIYLAVPVLAFLAAYSYAKRFTWLSHFWLGAALGFSPVAAWIAIRGDAVLGRPADLWPSILLGAAVLSWVAGFDIIYACQDFEYDCQAGLYSIPTQLGITRSLRLAAICHAVTVVLLAALPLVYPWLGAIYWTAVAAVAALLVYEHILVRPDDLTRVNKAFFQVNAFISIGLFAIGTLDLLLAGK